MFVQFIEGAVSDREAVLRQIDRWDAEVRPGAIGFRGEVGGLTDDDRVVMLAMFASAAEAAANSDRPEQSQWFTETEKCFESAPTFTESEDIEVFGDGLTDTARFVQVMKGSADRVRLAELDAAFEQHRGDFRPDVLGLVRAWTGPTSYVEAVCFTSEDDARANETKDPPAELAEQMAEFGDLMSGVEFIDLHDPKISLAR